MKELIIDGLGALMLGVIFAALWVLLPIAFG